jgi:ribokinase
VADEIPGARAADIVVVGSINVDFVVRTATLPRPGETVSRGTFERFFGGKGANQAVAAARLGARVTLVGAVGDDRLADDSLMDLAGEGIDASRVSRVRDMATGVALIVVDAAGENQIAVASGANAALSADMVKSGLASWTPTPGAPAAVVLVVFEVGDDAVAAAARFAAERGLAVVVNPAPARPLPAALLEAHAIVVVNEGEAETLTGHTDADSAARALSALTGAPAVVTLGADGALVCMTGELTRIPAPPVEVVDTTGAGDTFVGALAAAVARGTDVVSAARFAVAAAARSVGVAGARGGMPRWRDMPLVPPPSSSAILGDEDLPRDQ